MHDPLSQRLAKILEADSEAEAAGEPGTPGPAGRSGLTLNALLERTAGRGLYLVMVILCAPFIAPLPVPALSTIVGAVLGVLAIRLALDLPPRLPRFLGERPLPPALKRVVLGGSVKVLAWIERFVRPRRTQWLGWPVARVGHALLILAMAFLMSLPVPPIILFSNTLPSLAIILIAVSMMEEDGLMIWLAYLTAVVTVLWFALSAGVIVAFLSKAYAWLMEYLQNQP